LLHFAILAYLPFLISGIRALWRSETQSAPMSEINKNSSGDEIPERGVT